MRTSNPPPALPSWFIVDAQGKNLGRLATRIAHVLHGKHRPGFSGHQIHGDHVVVLNVGGLALHPRKIDQKVYHRHSGYLGNLKAIPMKRVLRTNPSMILARAVRGMLPRNRLRPRIMRCLHVYSAGEHPHAAQQPRPLEELFPPRSSSR